MKLRGFYFITDRVLCKVSCADAVRKALDGGASVVQYREKDLDTLDMVETAKEIRTITSGRALFIINDRVDVALASGADGVHLGQDDMNIEDARRVLGSGKIIGVTVHNLDDALEAEKHGADYLGVSPIFPTSTKKDAGPAAGLNLIKTIKSSTKLPCVAIGGINESNVDAVIAAGADAVAAISATVAREDIERAVRSFARRWQK